MTTPQEHDVAQVMLALRCTTGVAAKDVDDCHPAVRDMAYTQARNLIADPWPLVSALLGTVDRDRLATMAVEEERQRANRSEIELLVSEQDVTYWSERADRFETLARDVLATFTERGYPGQSCRRTGWVPDDMLRAWTDTLNNEPDLGVWTQEEVDAIPGKVAALKARMGLTDNRCDVCDEPCDDLHSAEVDGDHLDVCWRCCPDCPTRDGVA